MRMNRQKLNEASRYTASWPLQHAAFSGNCRLQLITKPRHQLIVTVSAALQLARRTNNREGCGFDAC